LSYKNPWLRMLKVSGRSKGGGRTNGARLRSVKIKSGKGTKEGRELKDRVLITARGKQIPRMDTAHREKRRKKGGGPLLKA